MNINEYVYVKLNENGKTIASQNDNNFRVLNNGWTEWQLWILMNTFGEHLHIAGEVYFENNEIRYRKPKDA